MSKVHYLKDYSSDKKLDKRPRTITFYSPNYTDEHGRPSSVSITVRVEDGDVGGILTTVIEMGGIGQTGDDGVFRFVPWPCAAFLVRDV